MKRRLPDAEAMQRRPIIAILTDFGIDDGYVASMKGIILSRIPTAQIIDITHTISPYDIDEGSYILWSCFKYFPAKTIFIAVVDPGVGTKRKVIAVGGGGYSFLAPDNGLLKFVLGSMKASEVVEVNNSKLFHNPVSRTFHGRDIFASVAGYIASGTKLSQLGKHVKPSTKPHGFTSIRANEPGSSFGEIIHIDRFGNIVTDFKPDGDLPVSLVLKIRGKALLKTAPTYDEGSTVRPFLILGSNGLIEISLKNGNAARTLKARTGEPLTLEVQRPWKNRK